MKAKLTFDFALLSSENCLRIENMRDIIQFVEGTLESCYINVYVESIC